MATDADSHSLGVVIRASPLRAEGQAVHHCRSGLSRSDDQSSHRPALESQGRIHPSLAEHRMSAAPSEAGRELAPWEQKITGSERRFCERLFAEYDADGSGTIDLSELGKVMEGMGAVMTPAQLLELFEQVDVDGSQEVSFQEFLQLIMLYKEGSQYMFFEGIQTSSKDHVKRSLRVSKLIPDAPLRWPWNIMVQCVVLYLTCSSMHVALHSNRPAPDWMDWVDLGLSALLAVDVVLCVNTAYMTIEGLVDDTWAVFWDYLSSWMIPDVIGTVPFHMLLMGWSGARHLRWLRFFRLLKIPFIFVQSSNTQVTDAYIIFYYQVVPIVNILFWLALFLHCSAEVLIYLQELEMPAGDTFNYDQAMYAIMMTVSSVGYGDISMGHSLELRIFSCFVFLACILINGLVIAKVMGMINAADINSDRRQKMRETLAVMKYFDIPGQLQEEILQFQFHLLQHDLSAAYRELLMGLPTAMQENLALHVKIKYISMVPMFFNAHRGCKIALAQALEPVVCCPEQYIVVVGEEAVEMYFMGHGFADVLGPGGNHVRTIKKGQFYGEAALLEGTLHPASLKALTYCDLFKLHRDAFHIILHTFPKFKDDMDRLLGGTITSPMTVSPPVPPTTVSPPIAAEIEGPCKVTSESMCAPLRIPSDRVPMPEPQLSPHGSQSADLPSAVPEPRSPPQSPATPPGLPFKTLMSLGNMSAPKESIVKKAREKATTRKASIVSPFTAVQAPKRKWFVQKDDDGADNRVRRKSVGEESAGGPAPAMDELFGGSGVFSLASQHWKLGRQRASISHNWSSNLGANEVTHDGRMEERLAAMERALGREISSIRKGLDDVVGLLRSRQADVPQSSRASSCADPTMHYTQPLDSALRSSLQMGNPLHVSAASKPVASTASTSEPARTPPRECAKDRESSSALGQDVAAPSKESVD